MLAGQGSRSGRGMAWGPKGSMLPSSPACMQPSPCLLPCAGRQASCQLSAACLPACPALICSLPACLSDGLLASACQMVSC
jgi:hypothetical protein